MRPHAMKDEYRRSANLTVDHNVPVPMRDGTVLYADIYRPGGGRH